ncbi:N-acetyltransferase [Congregibacter brevis]|uniref:N-acetyltransferase n=1 Tax=Congregibacter brevis TaxID=3081201 RepID=A0ABZ0I8P5_9GAMM|nr:N-acetyltransferase [Congregibacter sp. IMCC45268]
MNFVRVELAQSEELIRVCAESFSDSEGEASGAEIASLVKDLLRYFDEERAEGFAAVEEGSFIGAIVFSELMLADGTQASLLSPVAVRTDKQSTGVGQQLIRHGLQQLSEEGADVVFTYGDPAYYSRFGFLPMEETQVAGPYPLSLPHGWQALSLQGNDLAVLQGSVRCVEAFAKPGLW